MSDKRIIKKAYKLGVDGAKRVSRQRRLWLDGVEDSFLGREQSVWEVVNVSGHRNKWQTLARGVEQC